MTFPTNPQFMKDTAQDLVIAWMELFAEVYKLQCDALGVEWPRSQ